MKVKYRVLLVVLSFIFVFSGVLGGSILLKKYVDDENVLPENSTSDTTSYVKVDELWDGERFNNQSFTILMRYLTGKANAKFSDVRTMANSVSSAETIRGKTLSSGTYGSKTYAAKSSSQDIQVVIGGLVWNVCYLSKDSDGNVIMSVWLSNGIQDSFAGRSQTEGLYYGFYSTSLGTAMLSDYSADWGDEGVYQGSTYPSIMYGTSYIRAVALNNGGQYAVNAGTLSNSAAKDSNSVFAKFTMNNVRNNLTDYIVTPRNVSWQEHQSTLDEYSHANDSWGVPTSVNWYNDKIDISNKSGYANWADDYIWIPSSTETINLWACSREQRRSYDGGEQAGWIVNIGTSQSNNFCCSSTYLRSGNNTTSGLLVYQYSNGNVNATLPYHSMFVRPAFHLNLTKVAESASYWIDEGNYSTTPWQGNGSENNPYLINSARDLARLSYLIYTKQTGDSMPFSEQSSVTCNYVGKYFKQTCDIDLSAHWWQPIGLYLNRSGTVVDSKFSGIYDGGGYTIDGLYTPSGTGSTYTRQGLFGGTVGYSKDNYIIIKNVTIGKNSRIMGSGLQGAIEGDPWRYIEISNCKNFGVVSSTGDKIGGIGGYNDKYIRVIDCINYGDVYSESNYVGGILGFSETTSINSALIENCVNYGKVIGLIGWVGGIVGLAGPSVNVSKCTNYGEVLGRGAVGGILGWGYKHEISKCANYGKVYGTGAHIGGVVGRIENASTIYECFNVADVEGEVNEVGGIVGCFHNNTQMHDCYNTGNVYSSYALDGYSSCGGLTGTTNNNCAIYRCYNAGTVYNRSSYASAKVGGLSGDSICGGYNNYVNCISLGNIISGGDTYTGRFIGYAGLGSASVCYYLKGIHPKLYGTTTSNFTGLSGREITDLDSTAKNRSWYTTSSNWNQSYLWDFTNTWEIIDGVNNGLPVLKFSYAKINFDSQNLMSIENRNIKTYDMSMNVGKFYITDEGEPCTKLDVVSLPPNPTNHAQGFYISAPGLTAGNKYCLTVDIKLNSTGTRTIKSVGHEEGGFRTVIVNENWQTLNINFTVGHEYEYHAFVFYSYEDHWQVGDSVLIKNWCIQQRTQNLVSDNAISTKLLPVQYEGAISNIPTRIGYTFGGWAANSDGTQMITNSKGNLYPNTTYTDAYGRWIGTGNIMLYSTWTPNNYTVVYNANGGSGDMPSEGFVYDTQKQLATNIYTKVGYTFAGWALSQQDAANKTVAYTNKQAVKNLTSTNGEKINLYAVWQANDYQVCFNSNNATETTTLQNFKYDVAQQLQNVNYSKNFYNFIGWAKTQANADAGIVDFVSEQNVLNLTAAANDVVNLYAVWSPKYIAKYDTDNYWYIEIGAMPQGRVSQSLNITLNEMFDNNSAELTESENIYKISNEITLIGYYFKNHEYCRYNNQWYKVQPIRWRLQGNFEVGEVASGGVYAVLDTIVYMGKYSTGAASASEYSDLSVESFFYNLDQGKTVENLMAFTPLGLDGYNASIYVASETEIQQIAKSFDVKFSDLMCDIIGTRFYYTRTAAGDNNIKVYSYLGFATASVPTYERGIQFVVKVNEFTCI